jgi:hypothetical protein
MPNASNGFVTAITGVISGFMVEVILKAFVDSSRIPSYMVFVYQMLGILALVAFVHVTKYWGTLYLFGWWFGSGIMAYSGLLSLWEFLFYSAILILVLFSRIKRGLD